MSQTVFLHQASAICALGDSLKAIERTLFTPETNSPLSPSDAFTPGRTLTLGQVTAELAKVDSGIDASRNNRLLKTALKPLKAEVDALIERFGAERIGVIVGSSTSGIAEGEKAEVQRLNSGDYPAVYDYRQQEIGAPSRFAAAYLGIAGPAWTISTACTSGAKALASASRLLQTGQVDAVIAGGCDTLCRLTVEGFAALGAVSNNRCNPFSANRCGINIGEGAAFFILSREPSQVALSGYGESSDAHHISAPHPEGTGAESALRQALHKAQLNAEQIDYVNLHGTATEQNDAMESRALARVFGSETAGCTIACSSTKALTGHTLGAAGALEAAFCYLTLKRDDGALPAHLWDGERDTELPQLDGLGRKQLNRPVRHAMSNSFAFGGNNISLIFSRHD